VNKRIERLTREHEKTKRELQAALAANDSAFAEAIQEVARRKNDLEFHTANALYAQGWYIWIEDDRYCGSYGKKYLCNEINDFPPAMYVIEFAGSEDTPPLIYSAYYGDPPLKPGEIPERLLDFKVLLYLEHISEEFQDEQADIQGIRGRPIPIL
jgi:hypothetical protein